MPEKTYCIRGRQLGDVEISAIRATVAEHWDKGRTAISKILCERWDWRQANGLLKERACRVLLLSLEKKGAIKLPPRLKEAFRHPKRADRRAYPHETSAICGTVSEFRSLTIKMVRSTPDEGLWDYLVDRYHYLGHPWIVGAYLKYIAYLDGHPVACLGWGSAAWKVACRDAFIGWDSTSRQANIHKVVNNVRFLILPWVRITHLASKLLAANIRILAHDWQDYYQQPVALLETFVEKDRFAGTCYKAANWQYVGLTKGRGKYDQHTCAKPVKAVYLYPLRKNYRELLHA
ncbi:MAG: hypothetical protein COZ12_03435 [Deltaproteobacteria bacterium CG_4_10_14_3_um_filter_60_8]|nr:MAG: hypothetical protein COX17_05735 [Deltaproteobacteria bacterium CG23_combo_of_CG06-09_8_20_14_all_60_8]PIY22191.1 MAG: hypothetical protein COZ12_03435 [Deltaproteobacteria bacterium CG_4_10_14_3_um_filter_60_8]